VVRTLGRTDSDVFFDLSDAATPRDLDGIDALVHLSYDFSCRDLADTRRVNVEGSRRLFRAATAAGVQTPICISTVAAFPGARSNYGRAKLEIERAAVEHSGCVIRPGLVWGPQGGAMFGALARAASALPVLPLLAPAELPMVLANEEDLGGLVATVLERDGELSTQIIVAGSRQTVTFVDLLRRLAISQGREPRFIRAPWQLAWIGLRALELAHIDPPFRSDSLVSLVAVDPDPFGHATVDAESLGIRFRPYSTA
jgi:nucleoside-diphosphate-sugar epimerase